MRCSPCTRTPTNARRRFAATGNFWEAPRYKHHCCFPVVSHAADICLGARTCVPVAAQHPTTCSVASSKPQSTLSASQIAEELYRYASTAAGTGRRSGLDDFLTACLNELSSPHRLRRLHPHQLASVLCSLVHLGAHPGEDWLADLDACCYCHPGPFDPASSTALLQALALLHTSSAPPPSPTSQTYRHHQPRSHPTSTQHRQHTRSLPASPWTPVTSLPPPSPASSSTSSSPFRFPHAVYLRLMRGGGLASYSYEQLCALLPALRCLGVGLDEAGAERLGAHMAAQLAVMGPEERSRALRALRVETV